MDTKQNITEYLDLIKRRMFFARALVDSFRQFGHNYLHHQFLRDAFGMDRYDDVEE